MRVITKYPIYEGADGSIIVNTILDGYSGIDGNSVEDVLNFQTWSNKFKGTSLTVDGIYGPKSKAEYNKYGSEYERAKADPTYIPKKIAKQKVVDAPNPTKKTDASQKTIEEKKEISAQKDTTASGKSTSKLSDKTKIALTISAVVLAVVAIRIIQKAVKK